MRGGKETARQRRLSGAEQRSVWQQQDQPLTVRGLTTRYLLALGLVATLSCIAYLALRQTIRTQESSAATVNVSGRQRMLSQRLAMEALQLDRVENGDKELLLTSIRSDLQEFSASHRDLVHGNVERQLPGSPSAALQAIYQGAPYNLNQHVDAYITAVQAIIDHGPNQQRLDAILALGPHALLDGLDAVVQQHQRESEAEVSLLLQAETLVAIATLCILCLEGLFIFRPMVRRVMTERSRLQEQIAYTQAIVDSCHDAILTVDASGLVAAANPAATELFGYSNEELTQRSYRSLTVESVWLDTVLSRDTRGSAPSAGLHHAIATKADGSTFQADIAVGSMRFGDQRHAVVILRESTAALQAYAKDLERINGELDQFAYVTSHDLKAPLRAIANLSSWIEEDLGEAPPAVQEHLALLRSRVQRLEALIEGIRCFAATAGDQPQEETVDLQALIQEVFDEQAQGTNFTLSIQGEPPEILTDPARLWQVIANLIANAIRHHHREAGSIIVSADVVEDGITLTICDDGPGIPAEHRDKVFVIFQTLKPKDDNPGIGLGLALVKKLVDAQNGHIRIGDAEGGGTLIDLHWPCTVHKAVKR